MPRHCTSSCVVQSAAGSVAAEKSGSSSGEQLDELRLVVARHAATGEQHYQVLQAEEEAWRTGSLSEKADCCHMPLMSLRLRIAVDSLEQVHWRMALEEEQNAAHQQLDRTLAVIDEYVLMTRNLPASLLLYDQH